jgi:hypothetical protein
MNLNPSDHSPKNNIWIQLLEIQRAFLARVNGSKDTSPPSPAEPSEINPSRISQLHQRQNSSSKPPANDEMRYRGQLKDLNFFYKFSESFNLMESFIKAQSANDLVTALHNLVKNVSTNFQQERSTEMFKHLNSNEGRIFLKHKIESIIDDTAQQILRDLSLNSSNSRNQGNSTDNDSIKSEANIATLNEAEAQPAETNQRDDANSSHQKLSSVIVLFGTFIACGLKHSARDLLLDMDEKFSKKLKYNPLAMITNEAPYMIIDTAQDPKKSGIETNNLIDYSNLDSSGNPVINVPETLKCFTQDYILPQKINLKPVDNKIQPYLNKVIRELDYQQVDSDSATRFYLKAVQKGYVGEANDFLTRAIQDRFKAFSSSDVSLQYDAEQGEFDEFTDLLKWAVDEKFLPEKNLKKILISLITETIKLKDDPEKLPELSAKYQLLETLLDRLQKTYYGKNTPDSSIRKARKILERFNNQQNKLTKSLTTLEQDRNLLKRSLEVDPSQAPNYEKLQPDEKESSEKESSGKGLAERLSGMTVPYFLNTLSPSSTSEATPLTSQALPASAHLHNTVERSKENVLKALREIYIQSALEISDGGGDEILDAIYISRESLIAEFVNPPKHKTPKLPFLII